jgi:ribonuclease BN (tRNA processing enzyme)
MKRKGNWVKFLGVGEGRPDAQRFHSSYLYSLLGKRFIIDAGEPAAHSLKQAEADLKRIAALLITHTHADHFGAIIPLIQAFKHDKRSEPLPVHMPGHAIKPLRALLDASYIFKERLPYKLKFEPLKRGQEIAISEQVTITPYPTTHVEKIRIKMEKKYPNIPFKAYAFCIEAGSQRIIHSGDLGAIEDLEPLLDRPVNLLVCELSHSPPRETFQFLRGKRIKTVAFVHVAKEYYKDLDKLKVQANSQLSSLQVIFPSDGEEVTF